MPQPLRGPGWTGLGRPRRPRHADPAPAQKAAGAPAGHAWNRAAVAPPPYAERFVLTARTEVTGRTLIFGERLAVTDQPRYQELARHYGPLMTDAGGTCGCHVHVGVPSRDLGVQALARLRALACLAARHHGELTDRGRPRHGMGKPAVPAVVTLADGDAACGVARRRRLRCGDPRPHRPGRGARRTGRLPVRAALLAVPDRRG